MRLQLLFTLLLSMLYLTGTSQFETVGIIGSATPGGWDDDTDMVQDDTNPNLWLLDIELIDGEAKFRAENAWDVNWGDTKFPIGVGVGNGPNIPVIGGEYRVTFNSETGEYFFDLLTSDLGVIGSATPFGWDREIFMFEDPDVEGLYTVTLDLKQGLAKFRADGNWDLNWGGNDFPAGDAIEAGPDIDIPNAGTYVITFDRINLTYSFEEQVEFESIGIIGSATPGGWDAETPLNRDPNEPGIWTITLELVEGQAKFRANNDWAVNWGGETFPNGDAIVNGSDINVPAGTYIITFNTNDPSYAFLEIIEYATMGIIGSATPGGFESLTEMERDENNVSLWSLRADLVAGDLFFAVDATFANEVWGGSTFPSGVAVMDASIAIPAQTGDYIITFNSTTGAYNFSEVVEYNAISLVGQSGPFGAWPEEGDMGARDVFLNKDEDDFNIWTYGSVALTDWDADGDGGIKFRLDTAWAINWGSPDFPEGVGVQNGPNIQCLAGTYSVWFNSSTGEYVFGPETSTRETILDPSVVNISPNPASDMVNVTVDSPHLAGDIQIHLYDALGKRVVTQTFNTQGNILLDVSRLVSGQYFMQITNGQYMIGKKLMVQK